ncbi:MAG: hypothetical protein U0V74_03735 [Chitinophagales bacterium]
MDNNSPKLILKHPRAVGALFMCLGGLLVYLSILSPIKDAQHHAADVSLSMGGIFVAVFSSLIGIIFLLFGVRFARFFVVEKDQSKTPVYITAAVISLVGLIVYMALQKYIEGFGYVF